MRVPREVLEAADNPESEYYGTYKQIVEIARSVRLNDNSALVLPSDPHKDAEGKPTGVPSFDLSLTGPSGRSLSGERDAISRYTNSIAQSILADFITAGGGASAAFSLNESKKQQFEIAVEGFARRVVHHINKKLIPILWAFNHRSDPHPYLTFTGVVPENPQILVDLLGRLAVIGMNFFPDENTEAFLRGKLGLPEPSEQSKLIKQFNEQTAQQQQALQTESLAWSVELQKAQLGVAVQPQPKPASSK